MSVSAGLSLAVEFKCATCLQWGEHLGCQHQPPQRSCSQLCHLQLHHCRAAGDRASHAQRLCQRSLQGTHSEM
jgi:hypothetical protein